MFEFHEDRKRYFDIQVLNAEKFVIPFITKVFPLKKGMRVLEIGCGEGGVLKAFINQGCIGVGVEMDESRIINAKEYLKDDIEQGKILFILNDIYKVQASELENLFDVIVLKDVIEHIHHQEKLIGWMKNYLNKSGVIFFGFPPWQMPFGGHQQMCTSWVRKIPWVHLLPKSIYGWLLKKTKDGPAAFLEIKETGISIERFEKICKNQGFIIFNKLYFLINPIYEWKFGWQGRKQLKLISAIPWVRNFFTTCAYYLIKVRD